LSPKEQDEFRQNGILACALKRDMVTHNIMKVKSNQEPVAPIFAVSSPKEACKESSERSSGLVSKIILSRKTVIRLTSNLWTKAGLTNGAVGTVHSIIYEEGEKPPSLPTAIIVIFNDYIGPSYLPGIPNAVPIVPVRREWYANKIHCSRTMLPIILGYALSIHKLQGSTCDRVILNPGKKEFAVGLLLVGATRTKTFEGLAISPYPNFARFEQVNKSKSLKQRIQEEGRMKSLEVVTIKKYANILPKYSNENISLEDNTVSELFAFQGLIWGIGLVINSCTLDNFITALWLWSDSLVDFMENLPVEILLKSIITLLKDGNQSQAKVLWASYLQDVKKIQVLRSEQSFNVFGSESQMLFQHLKELQEINCTAICSDCKCNHFVQVREVLIPTFCSMKNFFDLLQTHIHLGACQQCGSTNFNSLNAQFVRSNPWIFFVDVEGSASIHDIQGISKTVKIFNVEFSLAYISLHSRNHYTGLFWHQERWMHYDGRANGAMSKILLDPSMELSHHIPVHVVYFRLNLL
jgi:hypothetical protein